MTKPNGVHHFAICTADIKAQIAYFTDVLGMELVALYWMHGVEGAWHGFLKLNDQCSIAFVKQGATAIGVDHSAEQLAFARRLCEREEVRVELRQGDLADLAFVSADSIDLVFSAYAFGYVEDLNRVFRQVHRVLKVGAPLVFSLPHPAYDMIDDDSDEPLLARRSYFDKTPIDYSVGGIAFTDYHHTLAEIYMGLVRASYRVDVIMEPPPRPSGPRSPDWREAFTVVPRTLIIRARKEGS